MDHRAALLVRLGTAGSLLVGSGLHVAWGRGSSFPFATSAQLTDNVVGSPVLPSTAWCYGVAAALGAVALVAVDPSPTLMRRFVRGGAAAAFGLRASFGFAGRTHLLVPGSASPSFRRNDRWILSPICAALAAGLVASTL